MPTESTPTPTENHFHPAIEFKKSWFKMVENLTELFHVRIHHNSLRGVTRVGHENFEEHREQISRAITGKPWPEAAVILEDQMWKRWESVRAERDGEEEELAQIFYETWKDQEFPCLQDEHVATRNWFHQLIMRLVDSNCQSVIDFTYTSNSWTHSLKLVSHKRGHVLIVTKLPRLIVK